MYLQMFLGGSLTVGSLELPVQGEVILGVGTDITLDHHQNNEACTGKHSFYIYIRKFLHELFTSYIKYFD